MKNLRYILFVFCFCPLAASAQTEEKLCEEMTMFKEYCFRVRNAVEKHDADELIDCIVKWQPSEFDENGKETQREMFIYKNVLIEKTPFSDLQAVDTADEIPTEKHLKFLPQYVDELLVNDLETINLTSAHHLRSSINLDRMTYDALAFVQNFLGLETDSKQIEYTVKALKSGGKTTYKTSGKGRVEMFAVSENPGTLNFYVKSPKLVLEDSAPNGKAQAELVWRMSSDGEFEFTIENKSEKPQSFIVAKFQNK
ncbi:MAG: hypothetical protein K5685_11775 [Bacteroidales bacterium]|nr:hypothetical protein [Bacteroidales bacterium]